MSDYKSILQNIKGRTERAAEIGKEISKIDDVVVLGQGAFTPQERADLVEAKKDLQDRTMSEVREIPVSQAKQEREREEQKDRYYGSVRYGSFSERREAGKDLTSEEKAKIKQQIKTDKYHDKRAE